MTTCRQKRSVLLCNCQSCLMCAALWQADTHASLSRVKILDGKLLCIIFIARTGLSDGARQNTADALYITLYL